MRRLLFVMLLLAGNSLFAQRYHLLLDHIVGQDSLPQNILVSIFQDRIIALETDYDKPLPRGTIDLRSFWAAPMFFNLQTDSLADIPPDITYLDLNWYDQATPEVNQHEEIIMSLPHPIIKEPLLLELPTISSFTIRLPAILYYSEPEQLADWIEAARKWGFSLASPLQYPPRPELFRHTMRHSLIMEILNGNRPGRIFIQDAALIPGGGFAPFQKVISESLLPRIPDSLLKTLDYVLFPDLNSYFACLDTINQLPKAVLPLIADSRHWLETAQRVQSVHFFEMLWNNPANYFGLEADYGGIEAGKKANIFFMDKNPIDIGSKIVLIMKDGKFRECADD
jgi:hypothetical protein